MTASSHILLLFITILLILMSPFTKSDTRLNVSHLRYFQPVHRLDDALDLRHVVGEQPVRLRVVERERLPGLAQLEDALERLAVEADEPRGLPHDVVLEH